MLTQTAKSYIDACYDIMAMTYGYVAQLDRASGSGPEGRGFESLHARS